MYCHVFSGHSVHFAWLSLMRHALPEIAVSSAVRRDTVSKIARTSMKLVNSNDVIVSNSVVWKYSVHSTSGKRQLGLIAVEYCIIDAPARTSALHGAGVTFASAADVAHSTTRVADGLRDNETFHMTKI